MRLQAIKYDTVKRCVWGKIDADLERMNQWLYGEPQEKEHKKNVLVNQIADEYKPGRLYLYKNQYPDIKPEEHWPFGYCPARKDSED